MVSIPGLVRSPGGGNGNPLQDSCLKAHGQELGGLHAWDHKESDTTERLNTHVHIHTHFIQVMTYAVRHWGTAMTIDGQISVQRKLTF